MIVAVDPGHAGAGSALAFFDARNRLVHVAFWRELTYHPKRVDRVVLEKPQRDRRTEHAIDDVIDLAWDGGEVAGYYRGRYGARVFAYVPAIWKGSESKPPHHRRLWDVLDDHERALLGGDYTLGAIERACERYALSRGKKGYSKAKADVVHNKLDAVALGCWFLDRLKKGSR